MNWVEVGVFYTINTPNTPRQTVNGLPPLSRGDFLTVVQYITANAQVSSRCHPPDVLTGGSRPRSLDVIKIECGYCITDEKGISLSSYGGVSKQDGLFQTPLVPPFPPRTVGTRTKGGKIKNCEYRGIYSNPPPASGVPLPTEGIY